MSPKIELLYFAACPHYLEALDMVQRALDAEDIRAGVELRAVETPDEAQQQRFYGSPTIRIDGADVAPLPAGATPALACRVYRTAAGKLTPIPPTEAVLAALRAHHAPPDAPPYRTLIPLFEELRGERLLLRPYRVEDAEALRAAIAESRDHLRPWLPFADAHQTIEETRDWILQGIARGILREVIDVGVWEVSGGGRFLGGLGIRPYNWEVGSCAIGYWLRASAEGHGYMAEAVRLATDYAFARLGANRVEIHCDARNARSAGVAQRLGFVREACLRNEMRASDGALRDTLVFALIPSDPRWP